MSNNFVDTRTVETMASEALGNSDLFREVMDTLKVSPFETPLLPEFELIRPFVDADEDLLKEQLPELEKKAGEALSKLTGEDVKLRDVITRISWLF